MKSDALAYVKKNIDTLITHYEKAEDPEIWLSEAIGAPAFVEVEGFDVEDFELIISEDSPSSTDVINIKQIYSKLSDLNDSFASDERLWAGLAHTIFYEYMLKRWPGKADKKSILNHYFFNGSRPRCYMVNTLSRLWWISKKTTIPEYENSFALLDYIAHDINGYSFTLFGSNWSNSEKVLKCFFDAITEYDQASGERVGRELFNQVMRYTNCLSGIYILDACDEEFIKTKLVEYLTLRSKELKDEAEYNKLNNVKTTGVEKLDTLLKAINKIGGHGKYNEIVTAYEELTQTKATPATKEYISNQLDKNCPDRRAYAGKPMFYWIRIGDGNAWKVANEYLIRENMKFRKQLMNDQIQSLSGNDRMVFNLITALNTTKFTLEDLYQFKQQMSEVLSKDDDPEKIIKESVKNMRDKGMLELIDSDTIKKAFAIKIN